MPQRRDQERAHHDGHGEPGEHELLHLQRADDGVQSLRGHEAQDDVGPPPGDDAAEADGVQVVEAEGGTGPWVAGQAGPQHLPRVSRQVEDLREAQTQYVDTGGAAHALLQEDDDVAERDRQGY